MAESDINLSIDNPEYLLITVFIKRSNANMNYLINLYCKQSIKIMKCIEYFKCFPISLITLSSNQIIGDIKMPEEERTSNDQKSDVNNPTNAEYKEAADNRSNQMNPNNSAYRSSRGKK